MKKSNPKPDRARTLAAKTLEVVQGGDIIYFKRYADGSISGRRVDDGKSTITWIEES